MTSRIWRILLSDVNGKPADVVDAIISAEGTPEDYYEAQGKLYRLHWKQDKMQEVEYVECAPPRNVDITAATVQ